MKAIPAAAQKPLMVAAGVVAGGLLLVYLAKRAKTAVLEVNAGTPYYGAGVLGTLGNFTNNALGNAPQSAGESVSDWLWMMNGNAARDAILTAPTPAAAVAIAAEEAQRRALLEAQTAGTLAGPVVKLWHWLTND